MTKRCFVYAIAAIDDWGGWHRVSQALATVKDDEHVAALAIAGEWGPSFAEIMMRFRAAAETARKVGWDGDIRGGLYSENGPLWAPLPSGVEAETEFLIAWKQDNNGGCFIVSPYPLPWLAEADYCTWDSFLAPVAPRFP